MGWIREYLIRAGELDQLTKVEKCRMIRDAGSLLHIVSDNHDRKLLLELKDQLLNFGGRQGIESRGRFIHQDDRRTNCDGPCDAEPLLLAARKAQRAGVQAVFDLFP